MLLLRSPARSPPNASGGIHVSRSKGLIEKDFAAAWIIGLVPPKTLETQAKCPNGVSKVETKLSFLNQLVAFLTLDIYTPMMIKVTCAQGGRASLSPGTRALDLGALYVVY